MYRMEYVWLCKVRDKVRIQGGYSCSARFYDPERLLFEKDLHWAHRSETIVL